MNWQRRLAGLGVLLSLFLCQPVSVVRADEASPPPSSFLVPSLAVPIPGVTFRPPTQSGNEVNIPFLADYINGVYRFSITLGMLLAIIMVMWGGFRYLAGATVDSVSRGKEIIENAVAGFAILLGAVALLNTVSPLATRVQSLSIPVVVQENGENGGGDVEPDGATAGVTCGDTSDAPSPITTQVRITEYRQYSGAWGSQPFGKNLANPPAPLITNYDDACVGQDACVYKCHGAGDQQGPHPWCTTTFAASGCGVTADAVILAYAQTQYEGHTINPLDVGKYAVQHGYRPRNGRTHQYTGTSAGVFTHLTDLNPNLAARSAFSDAATAARVIRAGYPIAFLCSPRHKTIHGDGELRPCPDHYMVLTGVSTDGNTFLIHDVGWRSAQRSKYITASELSGINMWAALPTGQTVDAPTRAPFSQFCIGGGASNGGSTPATTPSS